MPERVALGGERLLPGGALEMPRGKGAPGGTWQHVVALRYGERDSAVRRLLAVADLLGIVAALAVSMLLLAWHPDAFGWSLLVVPLWIVVFKAYGLYDRDRRRMSHQTLDDLPWIFHAVLIGCLLLLAGYRLLPVEGVYLGTLAVAALLAIVFVTSLRALARRLAVSILGPEPVVLLGEGTEISALAKKLAADGRHGARSAGLVPLPGADQGNGSESANGEASEAVRQLEALVRSHGAERVVVAREDFDSARLFALLGRARELGVQVSVLPQLLDPLGPSVEVDDIEGITVLGINPPLLPRSSRFLKRSMDLVGAAALLLVTAPLFAVIAVAIKLDSRGPVFFRQERIGKWGCCFRLAKFRTMRADAEELRESLLAHSKDPGWLHLDEDPRVTRVGGFLRRSSLDELPQLWNVLKGEMSLVGPRPIIPSEDSQLEGWRRSRIDISPGITGLWQVMGRTDLTFEEMIRLDYHYLTNWSLWTDVRLVLRTLPAVLRRRGAN